MKSISCLRHYWLLRDRKKFRRGCILLAFFSLICTKIAIKYFDGLLFVETFDCNIAFIDIIVQPLTDYQLFVSLSSITLKNILFCFYEKSNFRPIQKSVSLKTLYIYTHHLKEQQPLGFKVYSENIHSFIQQTSENCC